MITGIVLLIIAIVSFVLVIKTDLENTAVEHESFGRIKVYLGIAVLFIIGIVSIVRDVA